MYSTFLRSIFQGMATLFVSAASLFAASESAVVTGTVTDPSGAAVNAASISLHQVAGAAVLTNMSENTGRFVFRDVAPGDYLIDASAPGLTIVKPETLTVVAGENKRIAIHLAVSAVKNEISVTAASEPNR